MIEFILDKVQDFVIKMDNFKEEHRLNMVGRLLYVVGIILIITLPPIYFTDVIISLSTQLGSEPYLITLVCITVLTYILFPVGVVALIGVFVGVIACIERIIDMVLYIRNYIFYDKSYDFGDLEGDKLAGYIILLLWKLPYYLLLKKFK